MEHLELKARTTEVDAEQGTFVALVSGWSEDRMGDVIEPTAYDATILAWQRSGKWLPLLFVHTTQAIGEIDPHSMVVTEEGLTVRGHVDTDTAEGEQVWKQIKASTASFSIGFASESRPRKGKRKGREIYEVDLLEVSATSTPVQGAAKVLSWKGGAAAQSESPDLDSMSLDELRAYSEAMIAGVDTKAHLPVRIATFEC